ncbi:MAG: ABC-type cobalamin transport system ATPase subunit [Paraglaciecola sp.]|jgi:ABC-type cobalamin transport system ATPase subunit
MLVFSNLCLNNRLRSVSGSAVAGQFVHVLGANGAGKSSLLAAISGLLAVDSGTISLHNRDLSDYSLAQLADFRCLQEQQQNTVFSITVRESLEFFAPLGEFPACLEKALEIESFMHRPLSELSGGESRRVQIARVLWQVWNAVELGQAIILLDEPVQGLDFRHQHLLFLMLSEQVSKGNVVVVSHHDLNLCQQYAQCVWLMQNGEILMQGEVDVILRTEYLQNIFECEVRSFNDQHGNMLFQTYLN